MNLIDVISALSVIFNGVFAIILLWIRAELKSIETKIYYLQRQIDYILKRYEKV